MPKINNSTANLSDRLKDMLFNKRDEGYYFRKFQREKSLENSTMKKAEFLAVTEEKPKFERSASVMNHSSS